MKADSNSITSSEASPVLFEAEFEALLEEITSTTGEPTPITKLEEEIEQLKEEVAANLKRHAITQEQLQRTYAHLSEIRSSLKGSQERLEAFITAKEVDEIEAARERAFQNKAKMERIARFDEYFRSLSEAMQYLTQVKEHYGEQKTEEAIEALDKAKNVLKTIALSKEQLFPSKQEGINRDRSKIDQQESVSADFDFVLAKLEAEVKEWTEALIPESAKSASSDVGEGDLERGELESILHREYIIRTKKILVTGASSFSDANFLADLISSEEVLASFKFNNSSNTKNRLPPLKISRFMVDIKDVIEVGVNSS